MKLILKINRWAKGVWLAILGKQLITPLHGADGLTSVGRIEA